MNDPTMSTYDAVVVGAGVIGGSIALALARRGRSVCILDAGGAVGGGSTSASSAIVRFHYSTRDSVAMSWEALQRWQEWEAFLGAADPAGLATFVRTGALVLDSPHLPSATTLRIFDELRVPYERLHAQEIRARYPALDPQRFGPPRPVDDAAFWGEPAGELSGYVTPDAGYVLDPQLAAHNLVHAAIEGDARLSLHSRLVSVEQSNGAVSGVTLGNGRLIRCSTVVNAAGPWSSQVNACAGVGEDFTIGLRPLRQEVHQLAAPAGYRLGDGGVFLTDPDLGTYMRPHGPDMMIVGGMEPQCDQLEWLDDPDDWQPTVTETGWRNQTLRAARRLPELTVPNRPQGIAGVYDVSDDWLPIYDKTELPGFYVAIGTSGNQFKNAPVVGDLVWTLIDAVEHGIDPDHEDVLYRGAGRGIAINLASFSRRRTPTATSHGVMG